MRSAHWWTISAVLAAIVLLAPDHPGVVTADDATCGFVYALDAPAVSLPCPMARDSWDLLSCENKTLDPRAISETGDFGLWQVNQRWQTARAERMGYSWDRMLEAQPNTDVAAAIWREQSFRPWSCWR